MKWLKINDGDYCKLDLTTVPNLSSFKISTLREYGFLDGEIVGCSVDLVQRGDRTTLYKFRDRKVGLKVLNKLIRFLDDENETIFALEEFLTAEELGERL